MSIIVCDIIGLVVVAVGILRVAAAALSWAEQATYRRLSARVHASSSVSMHDVVDGCLVGLRGAVVASEQGLVTSPVSGRRGVCVQIVVHQYKRKKMGHYWHKVLDVTEAHDFFIDDYSGPRVRVISAKLRPMLDTTAAGQSGSVFLGDKKTEAASPSVEEYLRTKGLSSRNIFGFNKTMRFEDAVLSEGDAVLVVGASRRVNKETMPESSTLWQAAPWSTQQSGINGEIAAYSSKNPQSLELQLYGGNVAGNEVFITDKSREEVLAYLSQQFSETRGVAMLGGYTVLFGVLILTAGLLIW